MPQHEVICQRHPHAGGRCSGFQGDLDPDLVAKTDGVPNGLGLAVYPEPLPFDADSLGAGLLSAFWQPGVTSEFKNAEHHPFAILEVPAGVLLGPRVPAKTKGKGWDLHRQGCERPIWGCPNAARVAGMRRPRSLREQIRRTQSRDTTLVLLVTQGTETEPRYLDELRNAWRLTGVRVKPSPDSTQIRAVEAAT